MTIIVHTTTATKDEAKKIAYALMEKRFVACVNIYPIYSIYKWNGQTEEDEEYEISIKSNIQHLEEIKNVIISIHSYELPAIIWWSIDAEDKYKKWIEDNIK